MPPITQLVVRLGPEVLSTTLSPPHHLVLPLETHLGHGLLCRGWGCLGLLGLYWGPEKRIFESQLCCS